MYPEIRATITELLAMNHDALAGLVRLGADAGDPCKFVAAHDRLTVYKLLGRFAPEPRTAAGSLD